MKQKQVIINTAIYIDVESDGDYEFVRYGKADKDDYVLWSNGKISEWDDRDPSYCFYFIFRKKEKPLILNCKWNVSLGSEGLIFCLIDIIEGTNYVIYPLRLNINDDNKVYIEIEEKISRFEHLAFEDILKIKKYVDKLKIDRGSNVINPKDIIIQSKGMEE